MSASAVLIALLLLLTDYGTTMASAAAGTDTSMIGVSNKLAAITAAGQPVTLEELNNWYVEPPAFENAAAVYEEAFAVLTKDDPKSPSFLAQNQKAVALLLQAAGRKSCRYPVDLRAGPGTLITHLPKIKKCTVLLGSEALKQASLGQTDAASKSILAGLRLALSLDKEPMITSRLIEFASLQVTLTNLEQALDVGAFTDDQLASLQAALHDADRAASLSRILIAERCFCIAIFQMPPEKWAAALALNGSEKVDGPAYRESPAYQQDLSFALDGYSNLLVVTRLSIHQNVDAAAQARSQVEVASARGYKLSAMLLNLSRVFDKAATVSARIRTAQAALAVERYRLKHGNDLPGSLELLGPELIAAVPSDPFDGKLLRYQKLPGAGYIVFSNGNNQKGDHGVVDSRGGSEGISPDISFEVRR